MNINQTLLKGPISLASLETIYGLGVGEHLEKMVEEGNAIRTVGGNYLHRAWLRKGERIVLPLGVIARVDSVEGPSVRATPEIYPFNNGQASFNPVKFKIAAVRLAVEEEAPKPQSFVVSLPGYPSMAMQGETALKALTNAVAKLMEASSNKKIVFHDEWYGEPQFGALVVKLRPNLDRYVVPAPESPHEGEDAKTMLPAGAPPQNTTVVPPSPEDRAKANDNLSSDILTDVDRDKVVNQAADSVAKDIKKELGLDFGAEVVEQASDKIIPHLVGASFVDWAARHYSLSDICRSLNVTLREASVAMRKDFIKESDKKDLIRHYLMSLGQALGSDYELDARIIEKADLTYLSEDELAGFIVRQDQLRGIRPQGSTADKMACLWSFCAQADRKATENYAWRITRGNLQRRAGLQSTETPLVFTIWLREAEGRPKVLKIAYEDAMKEGKLIGADCLDLEAAAVVLKGIYGDWAEEATRIHPKLSELTKRAILGILRQE